MSNSVPQAVIELVGDPTESDCDDWFMQNLTLDELTETVEAINQQMRISRN